MADSREMRVPGLPGRLAMLDWLHRAELDNHTDPRVLYDIHRAQRLLEGSVADDQPHDDIRRLMIAALCTWRESNGSYIDLASPQYIECQIAAALVPLLLIRYAPLSWATSLAEFSSPSLAVCVGDWRDKIKTPRPDHLDQQQRDDWIRAIGAVEVLAGALPLIEEWRGIAAGKRQVPAAFLVGGATHEARFWSVPKMLRWLGGAAAAGIVGNRIDALIVEGIHRLLAADRAAENQREPQGSYKIEPGFLSAWKQGGREKYGEPLSDVFVEILDDGKPYVVQYFKRARFALDTNSATQSRVRIDPLPLK